MTILLRFRGSRIPTSGLRGITPILSKTRPQTCTCAKHQKEGFELDNRNAIDDSACAGFFPAVILVYTKYNKRKESTEMSKGEYAIETESRDRKSTEPRFGAYYCYVPACSRKEKKRLYSLIPSSL
mmetsp:Transcript_14687/g.36951  ORF Transcript_14687/g.36951 Transcript_14687/m.36951 type:complete len:126 (-) Transcript_14687:136-513(-)